MLNKCFCIQVLALMLLMISCSQVENSSRAQTAQPPTTKAAGVEYTPPDLARVEWSRSSRPQVLPITIEALLNEPPPSITLVFDCQAQTLEQCEDGKVGRELPASVKNQLDEYWKEVAGFMFHTVTQKEKINREQYFEHLSKYTVAFQDISKRLKTEPITTPLGERSLSDPEIREVLRSVNQAAFEMASTMRPPSEAADSR